MLKTILKKIGQPGPEFRGAPFWAWNAKLDEGELREQIRTMKKMGFGGFFMHARVGLATPYLSDEWFGLIAACADEAKKLGMKAWLYDEDRWPSGAAGGTVTKEKRYRMRFLRFVLDGELAGQPDTIELARFAVTLFETVVTSYRRIRGSEKLREDEHLMVFGRTICPGGDPWFNGQTYLDTLNPEAVEKFVEVTHEEYRKRLPRELGNVIPGIFTDEPNLYADSPADTLPWTDGLEVRFEKRFGYDLLDHLPELFYQCHPVMFRNGITDLREQFSKVRLDYRNLLADTFSRAFAKTIGDWCRKNGMIMTGHLLREDTLNDQCQGAGSVMRFYEYMDAPGIDLLTEHWNVFDTAKQCSSAAHQFGRKIRLSETYGCTGWDFPFMGHKALGDWQYALGINFRVQHLAWYSMAGEAKRDYPASISYQSPWRDEYRRVEEYFSRLGAALSEGEEQRDLLVIHPIESFMGRYASRIRVKGERKTDHPVDRAFITLTNDLLSLHLDFDFGEEELMSRHASVSGGKLRIGRAAYRAVLIPALDTIRKSTLDLLERFADRGGMVCFLDAPPEFLDGERSQLPKRVFGKFRQVTAGSLDRVMSPYVRRVSIYDDRDATEIAPALYLLKKGRGFETLFICNTGCGFTADQKDAPLVRDRVKRFPNGRVAWRLPENFRIFQLDLATGKLHRQEFERFADAAVFPCPLEALESRLFFATAEELEAAAPLRVCRRLAGSAPLPARQYRIELDEPNVLVLDTPSCRVDGGKKRPPVFCLKLDSELRETLGVPARRGGMVQPWLRGRVTAKRRLALELEYTFGCEVKPEKDCRLALERPDLCTLTFNGVPVDMTDLGWWCDRSIRLVALPAKLFSAGKNRLLVTTTYDKTLPGLESMYLLGDFGVRDDVLTSPVRSLKFGDWTLQGLPYYAGNLTYELELPENTTRIEFPEWRGVALAAARDDSEDFEMIGWPPFIFRTRGAKKLRLKVLGHRRNAMGPFFTAEKWPWWTGPVQFRDCQTETRGLVPCGLIAAPRVTRSGAAHEQKDRS